MVATNKLFATLIYLTAFTLSNPTDSELPLDSELPIDSDVPIDAQAPDYPEEPVGIIPGFEDDEVSRIDTSDFKPNESKKSKNTESPTPSSSSSKKPIKKPIKKTDSTTSSPGSSKASDKLVDTTSSTEEDTNPNPVDKNKESSISDAKTSSKVTTKYNFSFNPLDKIQDVVVDAVSEYLSPSTGTLGKKGNEWKEWSKTKYKFTMPPKTDVLGQVAVAASVGELAYDLFNWLNNEA